MNDNYELIEKRRIDDLNSEGYILRHKRSGARIMILSNDDENKVFYIGFRTPPYDSTGLPHILEHSVLCGSKKYPAKDPFVELAKGSLNTFLNAMTYPDKTVYPVASCNDRDLRNLMDVYMDAVLNPNIYEREQIFRQEGWHYELEDEAGPITINGVVYNEMKGAFSNPDDMLSREIFNTLFPDNAYSVESGGDPDVIPTLTYEKFLEFHKRYYHPSNSYIYLYGNMDFNDDLDYLDREYLSKYEKLDIDSEIALQEPFKETRKEILKYPITNEEPLQDNTYLSYNCVIDTSLNKELYLAFQILDYALVSAPGAVLTDTLLDRGIGKDVDSVYDNGIKQPYFSIIARNSNADRLDEFIGTIKEVLENAVKCGINKKMLLAGINYFEFKYREADFGHYPKGLMYGLQALDSWLYDDKAPFMHIEANETFRSLRDKVDSGYFEELVGRYLLNNTHSSIVILEPERGLTAKKDKALADKLKKYKASLSKDEIREIIEKSAALKRYQEEPDSREILEKIPLLKTDDLKKASDPLIYDVHKLDRTDIVTHDIFTNGIAYLTLTFDMSSLPYELTESIGLLKNILGLLNTADHSYADLSSEININCGGIVPGSGIYVDIKDTNKITPVFEIKAKALYDKLPFVFDMIKEILFTSDLSDRKRMRELVQMLKARIQGVLLAGGHSSAMTRALSYTSVTAAISEKINGIAFYRMIEKLEAHFDDNIDKATDDLRLCLKYILRPENLTVDLVGEGADKDIDKLVLDLKKSLHTDDIRKADRTIINPCLEKKNEGFKTAAKVQYVAAAGKYKRDDLPYTGALKVLKAIMGYDYLWNNVRVKGGAYGCMSGFTRSGDAYFVSYRDPNLQKTLDIYNNASSYIRKFDADERDMTKYIIGTMADLDMPLTPAAKGQRSYDAYNTGLTREDLQKERDEILNCSVGDIRRLADYIDEFLKKDCICVVGSEEKINETSELYGKTENLFME